MKKISKMKRGYCVGVMAAVLAMAACQSKEPVEATAAPTMQTTAAEATTMEQTVETTQPPETLPVITDGIYPAKAGYVKIQGRSLFWKDTLWLSYSASGIEFAYEDCTKVTISLVGDSTALPAGVEEGEHPTTNGHQARYAIYCNGEPVEIRLMTESKREVVIDTSDKKAGVIQVIKLSETADSSIGVRGITVDGKITPTPQKDLKIEFVGDSITCGYGVEDPLGGSYMTYNENAMKTYAYKTAQALDADYTFVSFSGYGVYSSYSGNGERSTYGLLPDYYDKQGNSYGSFLELVKNSKLKWDFEGDDPDVVVINLGTNDASYCKTKDRKDEFVKAYVDFLKMVRGYHPNAKIVCCLGLMGADLFPQIEEAVNQYSTETKDVQVTTLKLAAINAADGYAVDYHPNEISQEKAAKQLTEYLQGLFKK